MSEIRGRRGHASRGAEATSSQSKNEASASSRAAKLTFKNSQEFYSQNLVDTNENADANENGEEDSDISFMGEINVDASNLLQQDPSVRRMLRMKYRELLEAAHSKFSCY